jgi:6-pyruvoyltetrahydropterin/6-carboxytetrahydropterin synthase
MIRFCIDASFPATHRIRIDSKGTLEPLHAHNWRVHAWLETSAEHHGKSLREALTVLSDWVELHEANCFNEVEPFGEVNPTAEEVARVLAGLFHETVPEARVRSIEIGEAAGFSATYWPPKD